MAGHRFPKGHKFAPGGARPGAGRKPDVFKESMRRIASSEEARHFIEGGIKGEDVDQWVDLRNGTVVPIPPDGSLKLKMLEYATEHGYGKPTQSVEVEGEVRLNLVDAIREARQKRGLA